MNKKLLGMLVVTIGILGVVLAWAQTGPQPLSVTDIVPAKNVTVAHQWVITANQIAQRLQVDWWEGYLLPDNTFVQVRRKSFTFENHPDTVNDKGDAIPGDQDWDMLMTGATIGGRQLRLGDTLRLVVWALKQKGEL